MTSPTSSRRSSSTGRTSAGSRPARPGPAERSAPRPVVLLAALAGVLAAAAPLLVCAAIGVVGWFASDSGVHGSPSDGMRTGALAWLAAHGSTVTVQGTVLTMLPLAITLAVAWTAWRVGMRLGRALAGHGPDADRIADGERDLTVPSAVLVFAIAYGAVALVVARLVASLSPTSTPRIVLGVALLALLVAPAVAVGSGRASIWLARLPIGVTVAFLAARRVVVWFWLASTALVVVSLLLHWGTAANTFSQLHTSTPEAILMAGLSLLLLPNAAACGGAWLLGSGFHVGVGTFVSPGGVVLGALPVFPLLAALPTGTPGAWASWTVVAPALVAAAAVARTQWLFPCVEWLAGAVRGLCAGMAAGLVTALLAGLANGSVGPGRMTQVGPEFGPVLVHALVIFGVSGLLAGVSMTAYQRRTLLEPVTR